MSLDWQDSDSPARVKALAAAHEYGEFDHTVPTWDAYCDLREALIWALLITGFPPKSGWGITEKNWEQLYKRLHILERIGHQSCYRRYNNGAGNPTRDMYFTPEEVKSMIGLSVNAGNKSDAEFKKYVISKLMDEAEVSIRHSQVERDDPYEWERRQMGYDLARIEIESITERNRIPVCNNLNIQ